MILCAPLTSLFLHRRIFLYSMQEEQTIMTTEDQKAAILKRLASIGVKDYYTPSETARILDVPVHVLKYMRQRGKIEGTSLSGNNTLYTAQQIIDAQLESAPAGRKPKKRDDDGNSRSVTLLGSCRPALIVAGRR